MKIPDIYKIPLQGKMNKGVYSCLACRFQALNYNVTPHIIGFAESQWGDMVVWECPDCGQKQFFHLRGSESCDYVAAYSGFKNGARRDEWMSAFVGVDSSTAFRSGRSFHTGLDDPEDVEYKDGLPPGFSTSD